MRTLLILASPVRAAQTAATTNNPAEPARVELY